MLSSLWVRLKLNHTTQPALNKAALITSAVLLALPTCSGMLPLPHSQQALPVSSWPPTSTSTLEAELVLVAHVNFSLALKSHPNNKNQLQHTLHQLSHD